MTYTVERMVLGELAREEVTAVRMPRARFMEVVESVLEDYPDLRDELLPVAQSMPRFPMGTWINATRGCGCVVGEYLIAASELDRAGIVREYPEHWGGVDIDALLCQRPNGKRLLGFGNSLDGALGRILRVPFWDVVGPKVIVIEDEQEDATNV